MESDSTRPQTDLADYFRPLWARRWIVLVIVVAVTGGTYLYYSSKPDEYTAQTKVFVETSSIDEVLFGNQGQVTETDRNTQNQATLLKTRDVAEEVARRIDFKGDPAALLGQVEITPSKGTDFVTITATAASPKRAAALANAFARAFIDIRASRVRGKTRAAIAVARRELAALQGDENNARAARALRERIQRLQVISSLPSGTAEQVDKALPPGSPSAPKPKRNAVFGFFLGLLLGIVVAYLLDRLDRRIKGLHEVAQVYQLPVLAVLPHVNETLSADPAGFSSPAPLKEPFRMLRANIEFERLEHPVGSILVTSAVKGEGKSMVVSNLALTYAESGMTVVIVEVDLRRPTLANVFGNLPMPGLTEVLRRQVTLDEALQSIPLSGELMADPLAAGIDGDGRSHAESPMRVGSYEMRQPGRMSRRTPAHESPGLRGADPLAATPLSVLVSGSGTREPARRDRLAANARRARQVARLVRHSARGLAAAARGQ